VQLIESMLLSLMPKPFRPRLGRLVQYPPRPLSARRLPVSVDIPNAPTVSVVIPTYQQGHFVERTILSLLNQKYPSLELIVQDGGSNDETLVILKKYEKHLSGHFSEPDSGQSQAINRGFSRTCGEIMGWLNSDDLLLPGALHCIANFFKSNPTVDVVYGDRLMIDKEDCEIGRWILSGHDSELLSWADFVPQETLFWRRRIWDKAGARVDESLRFAMDWDLLLRFRNVGAVFAHLPYFLGAFRVHDRQKTSSEMDTVGEVEMKFLRSRELGRVPSRWQFRRAIAPYVFRHMIADWKYSARQRFAY
jgi:hypothetical protein